MLHAPIPHHTHSDDTWREIERLINEIAILAESDAPPERFYQTALEHIRSILAADRVAIWSATEAGDGLCRCRFTSRPATAPQRPSTDQSVAQLAWSRAQAQTCRSAESCLLFCPVLHKRQQVAMLEVALPPDVDQAVQESSLRLLHTVSELIGDFFRRARIDELQRSLDNERQWHRFLAELQRELDLHATAYCLANDGRRVTGCDRISVLVKRGNRCSTVAISGVDRIQRRAHRVRMLESLAAACARQRQSLWSPDPLDRFPPQVREPLEVYLDESHVRQIGVVPIVEKSNGTETVLALIVAENARQHTGDQQFCDSVERLADLSSNALIHALRFRRIPFSRLLWKFGVARTRKKRRLALPIVMAAVACTMVVFLLALVPAPLRVHCSGTLQPAHIQHLYAPENAIVEEVLAHHGEQVKTDQPLVQLAKPELGLEVTRTIGELQVARQQLQSVRGRQFLAPGVEGRSSIGADDLAAEEQRLNQQIDSWNRQLALLRERQHALRLVSSVDGQVLTWEPDQMLRARPVRQGQKLLTVAAQEGPWILDLRISERDVRHLLRARKERTTPLVVRFSLAANPSTTFVGQVKQISQRSELGDSDVPTIKVTAAIDSGQVTPLRAGSEVLARIDCGARSLGYVWLHDLWDTIRLKLLF